MRSFWTLSLCLFLLSPLACSSKERQLKPIREVALEGSSGEVRVQVEIANDKKTIEYGLQHVKKLGPKQGMLFDFKTDGKRYFWMKNTYVSLDLIFINSQGEVVFIESNTTPLSMKTVEYDVNAQFVIEVVAGFAKENGIRVGDKMTGIHPIS